jgi:uncharacterized membrane protein
MSGKMLGIFFPAAVFVFSYVITYLLYRHFSKSQGK